MWGQTIPKKRMKGKYLNPAHLQWAWVKSKIPKYLNRTKEVGSSHYVRYFHLDIGQMLQKKQVALPFLRNGE